ncbi:hypothetical protein HDU76_007554, partial [Blyttiomyces sp. JEL0837]
MPHHRVVVDQTHGLMHLQKLQSPKPTGIRLNLTSHDTNIQQSLSQQDGTVSSDESGWNGNVITSGTGSTGANFLIASASRSLTVSAQTGSSGSHTDGRSQSVASGISSGE